jgi:hypothetical protein
MNKFLKIILLGLIIWGLPFLTSFLVWDLEANTARIEMAWFSALMAFTWAVGFAIAACIYFRSVSENYVAEGWTTGIVWYIELLALDLITLVALFNMPLTDFYPMLLTYLNSVVLSASIGYILNK